jgi:hypothetical protein
MHGEIVDDDNVDNDDGDVVAKCDCYFSANR